MCPLYENISLFSKRSRKLVILKGDGGMRRKGNTSRVHEHLCLKYFRDPEFVTTEEVLNIRSSEGYRRAWITNPERQVSCPRELGDDNTGIYPPLLDATSQHITVGTIVQLPVIPN